VFVTYALRVTRPQIAVCRDVQRRAVAAIHHLRTLQTAGTALVGDFRSGSTLWVREGVQVVASDDHSTFFVDRKVAIAAETRVAFRFPKKE
jgi:hypothetical protein